MHILKRFDKRNFIFLSINIVFFSYLFVTGDPMNVGDIVQNQKIMQEPVYALLCCIIVPQNSYWLLILFQSMLAVIGNTFVIAYVRKRFRVNMGISLLFTGFLLVPYITTQLLADTYLVLANVLVANGMLFTLYPPAAVCLLDMIREGKPVGKKSFGILALFMLLSLIESRMAVLFWVWLLAAYVLVVKDGIAETRRTQEDSNTFVLAENIGKQGLVAIFAAVVITFAARNIIIYVFNHFAQGLFVTV